MNSAVLLETMEYGRFEEMFHASLQLKDMAALGSALRLRREATGVVRDIPALYCVGKHNEMILEYNHIGLGIEARQSALESLKHEEEFKDISLVLFPMFRSNFYQESLDYMTCASTSYEEGLYYFSKLKDEFPNEVSRRRYDEFKGLQSKYGRWFSTHRAISGTFYSRVNQGMDRGLYAGGLAVLDVILAHAQEAGYKLDYEEYVDLLDDMCALSIQLLMQKGERRPPAGSARQEANELGCILKKPMLYLAEFRSECLPKDRDLFGAHYRGFASVPWIDAVPEWEELRESWRDATSDPEEGAPKQDRSAVQEDVPPAEADDEGASIARVRCILAGAFIGALLSSFAFAPLVRFFAAGGSMRAVVPLELRSSLLMAFLMWAVIPGAGWGLLAGTSMPSNLRIGPLSYFAGALAGLCGVCCAWTSQWERVHQLTSGQITVAVLMSGGILLVIVPLLTMTVGLAAERLIRGK
jgi:hypothetical protein